MSLKIGSLFCGGGVGESRLNELGCKTIVANEIREDRCNFFQSIQCPISSNTSANWKYFFSKAN